MDTEISINEAEKDQFLKRKKFDKSPANWFNIRLVLILDQLKPRPKTENYISEC